MANPALSCSWAQFTYGTWGPQMRGNKWAQFTTALPGFEQIVPKKGNLFYFEGIVTAVWGASKSMPWWMARIKSNRTEMNPLNKRSLRKLIIVHDTAFRKVCWTLNQHILNFPNFRNMTWVVSQKEIHKWMH